jgi:tetratricopeptide (TPR) repeat protein
MFRSTISLSRGALAALCLAGLSLSVGCAGDIESRLAEVRALQDVGQFNASIEELRDILTVSPDLPEANYRLGLALVQTGEPSRAVWPLQKASESAEYEIQAGILLASTHFQTKNFDESVRAANRVLEVDPEREAALRLRAQANLSGRRLEESLEDTTRLVELHPEDYSVRALHATVLADLGRMEEAEAEHQFVKELGEKSEDPEFRIRACLAPAVFASDVLQDKEKAKSLYEECASRNPTDAMVLNHIVSFFDGIGDSERGTKLILDASESAPESLALRTTLAGRYRASGDAAAAEKVLLESVENFGSAGAWSALADFYRARKEPEKAIDAIEKVKELAGAASGIEFAEADVLIDLGRLDDAAAVAESIDQPVYQHLIRGRIALMRGDPKTALAAFEKGINAWPNNAGARFLAGLAARDLGDYERATSELRESVRAGKADTEAALELARIFYEQGKYQQAATFAAISLQGPRGLDQTDGYVLGARAMTAQGQLDRARAAIKNLDDRGYVAVATRERAILAARTQGPEAAVEAVRAADLDLSDPKNLEVLQQLVDNLTEIERYDEATGAIDAALAKNADSPALHELRGLALGRKGDVAGGKAAFEKAIELEPKSAQAINGLATLTANEGNVPRAIQLFDDAYAADPHDGTTAYSAAQLTLISGDRAGAIERLRAVVQRHPGVAGARNDLAWLLAEDGTDLDTALALAQQAKKRNASPEVLDTLGWVHLKRGETDEAIETLEQAVAGRSDSASIRYHLGSALREAGQDERAKEMLEAALALGAFPEADQARAELARVGN